jgi:hypothetical protein
MPEQLVTVGTYSTAYEANLVKSELEAFDIDAVLADDNAINMNWLWSNAIGGVKVRVPESEMEEARRIMRLEAGDGVDSLDPVEPAIVCPVCGSRSSHSSLDKRGTFLTWLLLGLPIVPVFAKRVCDDCGSKWKA